jgi:hypothetical protein
MKALFVALAAMLGGVVLGSLARAQQLVPVPDSIGGKPSDAVGDVPAGAPSPPVSKAEGWRYRQFERRWWYWMPDNRWMWYREDGRWMPFEAKEPSAANAHAPAAVTPCWTDYRPGVAVSVQPWGNVSVAVGRRIGVDVCGPHGAVRVGRTSIGW